MIGQTLLEVPAIIGVTRHPNAAHGKRLRQEPGGRWGWQADRGRERRIEQNKIKKMLDGAAPDGEGEEGGCLGKAQLARQDSSTYLKQRTESGDE